MDKTGLKRRTAQNSILFAESTNADLWQDCIDVCYIILGHKLDAIEIDLITADADYDAEFAFYINTVLFSIQLLIILNNSHVRITLPVLHGIIYRPHIKM